MQEEEIKIETEQACSPESSTDLVLANATASLNEESLRILNQLVAEADQDKAKDLTYLFNQNQNKKTLVRMDKLSGLQDDLVDQFVKRIALRPDEISNKELLDGIKIVQDIIERGQRRVGEQEQQQPFIQINQQTNSVNLGEQTMELNRESRERVKNAVLGLLSGLATQQPVQEAEYEDKTEDKAEGENTNNDG